MVQSYKFCQQHSKENMKVINFHIDEFYKFREAISHKLDNVAKAIKLYNNIKARFGQVHKDAFIRNIEATPLFGDLMEAIANFHHEIRDTHIAKVDIISPHILATKYTTIGQIIVQSPHDVAIKLYFGSEYVLIYSVDEFQNALADYKKLIAMNELIAKLDTGNIQKAEEYAITHNFNLDFYLEEKYKAAKQ